MAQIKIGFVGCESVDIILYVARLYTAAGNKVAVVDCTNKQALLRATDLPNALLQSTGFYKDILMLNGSLEHKQDKASQDVLLYNFGFDLKNNLILECQNLIYVTDMMAYNSELLKDIASAEDATRYLIIRNYLPLKYDEKYLFNLIGRKFEQDKMMLLPYDENDYKAMCYICTDKKHKLTGLSKTMKGMVMELFLSTSGQQYKRKEQASLLKRA